MATPGTGLQPQLSPALLFDTLNAYQKAAALKGAIELDVFTAIGEGADTPKTLAERRQASERGVRTLCDFLTIIGFLTKQDGRYALTPDSAMFLDRRSPAYMGTVARFLDSSEHISRFADVAAAVRKGGSVEDEGAMIPENPIWVEFARSMVPMMRMPAEIIAKLIQADSGTPCKVLDIAAGHGIFGITLARHNPNAEIHAVDWSNVLEVAKENAQQAGITSRYKTIPGSAFDVEFGGDYDLVLVTNFLHHFDVPTNERFLRKVHAALKPGARAVTLEFVPNDDRVSPPPAAMFSMTMLCATHGGDAYTFRELESMFRNAGFRETRIHRIEGAPQSVLVSAK